MIIRHSYLIIIIFFLARESRNDISAKRKSAMEIRLKKVRDRKRLKLGLPVLEDENETSKQLSDDATSIEPKEISLEDTVMESLRKMRDDHNLISKAKADKRNTKIREWDLGKEGVDDIHRNNLEYGAKNAFSYDRPAEKPVLSQSEWVTEKRQQRNTDFAPPVNYDKIRKNNKDLSNSRNISSKSIFGQDDHKSNESLNASNSRGQNHQERNVDNQTVFDNGLPQWNPELEHRIKSKSNKHETITSISPEKPKSTDEVFPQPKASTSKEYKTDVKLNPKIENREDYIHPLAESCKDQSTINLRERLKLHREMMNNYGGTSTLGRNSLSRSGI